MNNSDKKKPLLSSALVGGDNKGFASANADEHRDRITRFATLKHRAKNQENYLFTLAKFKENYEKDVKNEESIKALKSAQKLNECGNYLLFKNFYTIGEVKLSKLRTCGQHLLCPFCAAIRASRAIQKYVERINQVLQENRKLKPVLITLTVKNGSDLAERSEHLMKSFRTLLERRRDYLKKGWGYSEFCKVQGAMYSYENTYNEKTGEWHPHIHMFALVDQWIDQQEFSEYWHSITGDSMVVDVRRAKKEKGHGYSKAAAEVCKYALKFGDLSVEKTWEAFKVLKGKRLTGSFGLLWGVKIPDTMTDDMPDDKTLPYLEMLYKFAYGKKSYYDLLITRHVEPQAGERAGLGGASTTETERYSACGLSVDDARTLPVRGHAVTERPQRVHRKAHWRIPPKIRVRIKERIHRWDGFLYNIDLFPYVERRLLAFIE
ncbi:protein rep [Acinetobacter sp. YH16037]|uniref:protein rep n=5 Tax=unclassified Acinetobacter TaxID=196816 RepID=UPI0015D2792C|nr:protein rep [Acinetobacter sp. YH16037]